MNFIVKANSNVVQICDVVNTLADAGYILIYDRELDNCYVISNDDDRFHDCTEYDYELAQRTYHNYDNRRNNAVRRFWDLQRYRYYGDY